MTNDLHNSAKMINFAQIIRVEKDEKDHHDYIRYHLPY